jgi:hypothetical protein
MQDYIKLCNDIIDDHISDVKGYEKDKSEKDILNELLENTGDVFGNMTGSRTCNTYKAEQFLNKSGAMFDDDIRALFDDIDENYFYETLKRGAEVLDVVILELLAPQIINERLWA